ncbi:MAG: glutathione-dependent disulfide-bond oxidoreductase [Bdellovibrionales bacterium CG12_big_fil_rev_8_21_14_0_65_38_15]|nr:MAG: glutathione-dependent disulfide-bond oxidoreductase [Bdellovibrionales bacterium CG22_combo_CG10-13_8_21_14_all_38_13]PIQ52341.1 MAG: glutathione-dependent disulfide-bond oxidoreductase [Bdellovibrionales bacterium CG12_big_fil_rev_8_21_14_0_65_38_15]PIR30426.1 MAG: glutathione-dependent disulfide-bond oxidoreductase [Bdellovibrionales bacterium CG11_big_fil_rev_8_21_14_0_20_38_13]
MTNQSYTPPKVWKHNESNGGKFAGINRPTAGARETKQLPSGHHPFQLYSLATPNGVKVTIMFEELLALGIEEAQYDAYLINIGEGDQFSSGFVDINPNSKIPALLDKNKGKPIHIFESASILFYLAEKFEKFLPTEISKRTQVMNWLFWQMGSAPYLGGGFGHFYAYAPEKFEYPIDRFAMETKRQLDVLDRQLNNNEFIAGEEYSIADMAILPWYGALVKGSLYEAAEFLSVNEYKNVIRWADQLFARKAIVKGRMVNRVWGDASEQVVERHSDKDFEGKAING